MVIGNWVGIVVIDLEILPLKAENISACLDCCCWPRYFFQTIYLHKIMSGCSAYRVFQLYTTLSVPTLWDHRRAGNPATLLFPSCFRIWPPPSINPFIIPLLPYRNRFVNFYLNPLFPHLNQQGTFPLANLLEITNPLVNSAD